MIDRYPAFQAANCAGCPTCTLDAQACCCGMSAPELRMLQQGICPYGPRRAQAGGWLELPHTTIDRPDLREGITLAQRIMERL